MQSVLPFLAFISFAISCNGALYQRFQDVPKIPFDFVIIGGGTAGSVLANRLTEVSHFQVLVIEDGPTNEGVLPSMVPYYQSQLLNSAWDWNFTTVPQPGLNGHVLGYARGRILGGSSSINDMFYTRGSSSDYDRWATVTGDSGWSWNKLLPYILKMERWTPPADNHNTAGQFDPSIHNLNGMTLVSLPGSPNSIDGRVVQATQELQGEFAPRLDMNSGSPLGTSWLQSTIGHGQRSSAATSYLAPQFINRRNLHIVLNTRVTRVLQTSSGTMKSPIAFRTVEVAPATNGQRWQVTASKEVILSAGSVGTPHILMNSGIGDTSELSKLGIKTLVNLPSVGKNLTDHPLSGVSWFANSNNTGDTLANNATLLAQAFDLWNRTRTGPFTTQGASQVSWLRLPENSPVWSKFPDTASGRNSPHIELVMANGAGFSGAIGHFVGMGLAVVSPASRGTITLRSSDPFDSPVIDPGFYTSEFDVLAMLQAVRSSQKFYTASVWKGYVLGLAPPFSEDTINDDDAVMAILRNNTMGAWHPVSTAAMSAKGAKYGVVDPDLKVKGVSGLRIVDASIMPFVIAGHTQTPVYGIAERAADLVKSAWK